MYLINTSSEPQLKFSEPEYNELCKDFSDTSLTVNNLLIALLIEWSSQDFEKGDLDLTGKFFDFLTSK